MKSYTSKSSSNERVVKSYTSISAYIGAATHHAGELTLFSKIEGAKPALLGTMNSDQGNTLTHALVAEPHSSDQVQTGALQAVMTHS